MAGVIRRRAPGKGDDDAPDFTETSPRGPSDPVYPPEYPPSGTNDDETRSRTGPAEHGEEPTRIIQPGGEPPSGPPVGGGVVFAPMPGGTDIVSEATPSMPMAPSPVSMGQPSVARRPLLEHAAPMQGVMSGKLGGLLGGGLGLPEGSMGISHNDVLSSLIDMLQKMPGR